MRIVLDTNVLLSAISPASRYHWLLESIASGEIILCVSTDILTEYAELIERFYNPVVAEATLEGLLYSPFVERFSPSYFWRLIAPDHDDDRFVDCAVAGGADLIVTFDRHFDVLRTIEFPVISVLNPDQFESLLRQKSSTS